MDIDGEGGADGREQTRLVEVLVILLDIVCILLGRLPLVLRVEIETGSSFLIESRNVYNTSWILYSVSGQRSRKEHVERTTPDQLAVAGSLSLPSLRFRS